eukprot:TRINITY_DN330_c0_g1_i18.p2 TRINITY_DN330_c0_g1~~TRINITY_DN330_c0_g1_i18.p2  ORF type:complete len:143 (+),score=32.31 TRINITY_DN330_c0_g1_i18:290-718(+)
MTMMMMMMTVVMVSEEIFNHLSVSFLATIPPQQDLEKVLLDKAFYKGSRHLVQVPDQFGDILSQFREGLGGGSFPFSFGDDDDDDDDDGGNGFGRNFQPFIRQFLGDDSPLARFGEGAPGQSFLQSIFDAINDEDDDANGLY